jgi:ribose transport system permease protein
MKKEIGIGILFIALCLIITWLNPRFLSEANLRNQAKLLGLYGIFSIGMGIIIITGGIDLSVGSAFALQAVLLSMMLMEWRWPWPLATLAAIGLLVFLGIVHGFLITTVRLQPFIVTLCGFMIYRGLARFIANDQSKGFGESDFGLLRPLAAGYIHGVPMAFILLLIIAFVMYIVLHRSVYGRYLYAVGRNEEAAKYSGINTGLVIGSAYAISMLLAGITGIILAFYAPSISPSAHGLSYELYGIAAAVLGGCSLRGGEGSILGIVLGTAVILVLRNLVNLVNINGRPISSSLELVVIGGVILLGVFADEMIKRHYAKARSKPQAATIAAK